MTAPSTSTSAIRSCCASARPAHKRTIPSGRFPAPPPWSPEVESWSAEREKAGEQPIGIGIGVHYGEVLVGNIGDERRLEYKVLGDTVNVANRLERLTRETGASLVVSHDLVRAVRDCGVEPSSLVEGLHLSRDPHSARPPGACRDLVHLPATIQPMCA